MEFSAKVEVVKSFTSNHLTVDTTFADDYIETELEGAMERYEQKFDIYDTENSEEPHVYVNEKEIIVKDGDL